MELRPNQTWELVDEKARYTLALRLSGTLLITRKVWRTGAWSWLEPLWLETEDDLKVLLARHIVIPTTADV